MKPTWIKMWDGCVQQHVLVVDGVCIARIEERGSKFFPVINPMLDSLEKAKRFVIACIKLNDLADVEDDEFYSASISAHYLHDLEPVKARIISDHVVTLKFELDHVGVTRLCVDGNKTGQITQIRQDKSTLEVKEICDGNIAWHKFEIIDMPIVMPNDWRLTIDGKTIDILV